VKSGPAGPGRKIEVPSKEQAPAKPAPNLPGFERTQHYGTRNITERGALPEDDIRGLKTDVRNEAPPEWRSKVEGFKTRIARSKVTTTRRPAQPKPAGNP
jgi:hypothetical protein